MTRFLTVSRRYGSKDEVMARRSPQAQVALIAAAVFLVVGFSLAAVLIIGLVDGVTGSGPLLLAALATGVFALAIRLLMLARRPVAPRPSTSRTSTPTPPRQSPRNAGQGPSAAARPAHPRPQPRPRSLRP